MNVRFWGVRGSVAVSGAGFVRTGGNTSCVELTHDGERLILDGGTGLASLGQSLAGPVKATVLFTHVHWDHIQGVPFFTGAYHPGSELTFAGAAGLREALDEQMRPPQFPITMDALRARITFNTLTAGQAVEFGPFRVLPVEMTHPQGVMVYRIEAGGRAVVFATDVEHGAALDRRLVDLAAGADLLIHDAQYTDDEVMGRAGPPRRGWGHSSWQQAIEVASTADARQIALFHHDPGRDDAQLELIESAAAHLRPQAFAAREGVEVCL